MGAAEAYDRHVGRYGAQLASGPVEVAGLWSGQRALDVGRGPGPPRTGIGTVLSRT